MGKNVIYVDFIFRHKRITHFNYYITFAFSSILIDIKFLIETHNKKNHHIPKNKNSNKYINLLNYDKILRKTGR